MNGAVRAIGIVCIMLAALAVGCRDRDATTPPVADTTDSSTSVVELDLEDAEETCAAVLTEDTTAFHVPVGDGIDFVPDGITADGRIIGTQVDNDYPVEQGDPAPVFGLWMFDPATGALSVLHEGLVNYFDVQVNETGTAWMSPQPDAQAEVWFRPWQTGEAVHIGTSPGNYDAMSGMSMTHDYITWSIFRGVEDGERKVDTRVYSISKNGSSDMDVGWMDTIGRTGVRVGSRRRG